MRGRFHERVRNESERVTHGSESRADGSTNTPWEKENNRLCTIVTIDQEFRKDADASAETSPVKALGLGLTPASTNPIIIEAERHLTRFRDVRVTFSTQGSTVESAYTSRSSIH